LPHPPQHVHVGLASAVQLLSPRPQLRLAKLAQASLQRHQLRCQTKIHERPYLSPNRLIPTAAPENVETPRWGVSPCTQIARQAPKNRPPRIRTFCTCRNYSRQIP